MGKESGVDEIKIKFEFDSGRLICIIYICLHNCVLFLLFSNIIL